MHASKSLPPELSDGGYLQVGDEAVRISIANPHDYFWVGDRAALIQKNLDYFIGIKESEFGEDQVFAIPRVTWDEQGTAWITEQNEIVFGIPIYTVRGTFYLRPGEWLTVVHEDEKSYRVLCARHGKTFPIELKKREEGVTYLAGLPDDVEERVIRAHAQSSMVAHARPVITDELLRQVDAPAMTSATRPRNTAAPAPSSTPVTGPSETGDDGTVTRPATSPEAARSTPSPARDLPESDSAKQDAKWLISNTSWSQAQSGDRARVITPETVHTTLAVDEEPVVEEPPPAEPAPPVAVAESLPEPPPTEAVAVASALGTPDSEAEEAASEVDRAPIELASVEPEQAPEEPAAAVSNEAAVAMAAATPAEELAGEADADLETAAAAGTFPVEISADSTLGLVVKGVLLLVAVLAAAIAVIMGLAWVLNRKRTPSKTNKKLGARTEPEQIEETRPSDPAPPPLPLPAGDQPEPEQVVPDAPGLEAQFSEKISLNGGVFTGTLDGLTVSQLVQFIHSVEETGALSVTHGNGQKAGKVMVRAGEIIDAQCEDLRGEEALREIIGFQDGIFAFARQSLGDHEPTVNGGTMAVLMNVLKDYDEAGGDRPEVEEEEEEETTAGAL